MRKSEKKGPNSKSPRCPIFKFFVVTREVIFPKMAPILDLVSFFWVSSLRSHCATHLALRQAQRSWARAHHLSIKNGVVGNTALWSQAIKIPSKSVTFLQTQEIGFTHYLAAQEIRRLCCQESHMVLGPC